MFFDELSKAALLSGLGESCRGCRREESRVIAYLVAVEERRIHLEEGYETVGQLCQDLYAMSEDESWRRVTAARIVKKWPLALSLLESNELTLTSLLALREKLTDDNAEDLIRGACGKSKRQVQEMLAARFPVSDVLPLVQEMTVTPVRGSPDVKPDVSTPLATATSPLSAKSYLVQFTADVELYAMMQRATELLGHRHPSGDVVPMQKLAFEALIEKLEKETRAKTDRQQKKLRPAAHGHIRSATRRAVFERDGDQCSFVSSSGRRCTARTCIEIDHKAPKGLGGSGDPENGRAMCRRHNLWLAEQVYGRDVIEKKIARAQAAARKKKDTPPLPNVEPEPPRQRVDDDVRQKLLGGLKNLQFDRKKANAAVDTLTRRPPKSSDTLTTLMLEAIQILA